MARTEHFTEWDGGQDLRTAARGFRRSALGLAPLGPQLEVESPQGATTAGEGVQLTIDTQSDTYEQALAAV